MDNDLKGQVQQKSLITDEYYYKYIFKKTEKIVSAVFFMISKGQQIPQENVVRADLERRAKDVHSVALSLLNLEPDAAAYGMQTLLHGLVSLDSILNIFQAMGGISEANRQIISFEIEGVQRSMRRYLGDSAFVLNLNESTSSQPKIRHSSAASSNTPASLQNKTASDSGNQERSDRIIGLLKDIDGLGIKDIAAVITDCSEKTIQRELMSLIENGLVKREGERRWSRYFLV